MTLWIYMRQYGVVGCRVKQELRRCLSSATSAPRSENGPDYADVVIAGGGMVGASMACALAYNGYFADKRIMLLEAAPDRGEFKLPDRFSNRTCALSPATVRFLSSFGAWQEIEKMRCQPVRRMQVWESCSDSMISFSQDLMEPLAYIVENDVILAAIMQCLQNAPKSVEICFQSLAEEFAIPGLEEKENVQHPYVRIQLQSGQQLETQLLIGADGAKSEVRTAAKLPTMEWSYKQTAVVATVQLAESTENTVAWQRFLPTGPIALLPLSDKYSSLVWTTTPKRAKHLLGISEESFVDAVNDAIWHERDKNMLAGKALMTYTNFLRKIVPGGMPVKQLPPTVVDIIQDSRAAFPLHLVHSSQYVRPRVALVGDAAHRLHPLAGQGVNLGFGDVTSLAQCLERAVFEGSDLGSLNHLLAYETERQRHNVPVMATIDRLQRLYSTSFTPLVLLRSIGLSTVNSLGTLKDFIIRRASS